MSGPGKLLERVRYRIGRLARARRYADTADGGAPQSGGEIRGERIRQQFARTDLDDIFRVIEVHDADFLVGALFRRRYGIEVFPATPHHFVGMYRFADGRMLPLGYVHHTLWAGSSLSGGLVIDERLYRLVPERDRARIRDAGGVAELTLRGSVDLLPDGLDAVWARVGHKQSEKVCLRAGYRHAEIEYLMVIWLNSRLSPADRLAWIGRVQEYGPF